MGCCRKEVQKDRNKYVITPWRWELDGRISFLDLYTGIYSTPNGSTVMRLTKEEHPHSPLPSLLSYHNEHFDILWYVWGVLMNFHRKSLHLEQR